MNLSHQRETSHFADHVPDYNPIEKAASKLKANLRRISDRAVIDLWNTIESLVTIFKPPEHQD